MRELNTLTLERLRSTLEYVPETGRLIRKSRGLGARVGVEIGHIGDWGQRRAHVFTTDYMTAHLVWFWHHGQMPSGVLRHLDGDNANDRIENLALVRKPVRVLHPDEGIAYADPPDNTAGIYAIVHISTGRKYVGSALNVAMRWRDHQNALIRNQHRSIVLQRAWNKHGTDAFGFRLLLRCAPRNLLFYEQRAFDAWRPEFNCVKVAGSQLGYRHTDDTRMKMSASAALRPSPFTGRRHSEETKQRIANKKRGRKFGKYSAERVQKTAEAMRRGKGALTAPQVLTIRRMKQEGSSHQEVANVVGCSYWAVADVARGRSFAWVT